MNRLPFLPSHLLAALSVLLLTALVVTPDARAEELSAQQIIDRALDQHSFGFQSGHAQITLQVHDKAGDTRIRKLDVKSKKADNVARTRATLTAPKEVRGQAFLFVENKDKEDDVWMYVPAFGVTRRIEGSQKRGSFMGTHFTYADLESRDIKDARYKRHKDEKIGDTPVYVIEAAPKASAKSEYSRVVVFIRQSDHMPLRVRFYDKSGKLEKTLFVEKLDKTSAGKTFIRQMTLRAESGGYTTIVTDALDVDAELPDALFAREQLGN